MGRLTNGLLAGAAGTAALNAVTYADMAIRGRAASSTPQDTVSRLAELAGMKLGDDESTQHRRDGLGALIGYATGVTVGALVSVAGARRVPVIVAGPLLAAAAMAASDGSMAALGVTDPRTWQRRNWITDAVPHLAYGMVTAWALHKLRGPKRSR